MRWERGHQSSDVEDRRAASGGGRAGLGGGGINVLMWLFSRFGLTGVLVGGAVLYFSGQLFSGAPLAEQGSGERALPADGTDPEAEMVQFVSFVLDDVQASWTRSFAQAGQRYT